MLPDLTVRFLCPYARLRLRETGRFEEAFQERRRLLVFLPTDELFRPFVKRASLELRLHRLVVLPAPRLGLRLGTEFGALEPLFEFLHEAHGFGVVSIVGKTLRRLVLGKAVFLHLLQSVPRRFHFGRRDRGLSARFSSIGLGLVLFDELREDRHPLSVLAGVKRFLSLRQGLREFEDRRQLDVLQVFFDLGIGEGCRVPLPNDVARRTDQPRAGNTAGTVT